MSQSVWLGCVKPAVKATPPPLGSGVRAFLCVSASFEEFCASSKTKKYQESGLLFLFLGWFFFFFKNRAVCCMYCHLNCST